MNVPHRSSRHHNSEEASPARGPGAAAHSKPVLVTGASGYIGGRLVPRLLESGRSVVCLVRDARKLEVRSWAGDPRVRIVEGSASDSDAVQSAMRGCGVAYYLIHSMISKGSDYRSEDRSMARIFAKSAASAGLDRIIYLGGLGETGSGLSQHLASRREVEDALASGRVPVTVLRAAMIVGSGSASFEILRYLVERLPAMITPRWVGTECQPISIRDTLHYLISCLEVPQTTGRTLDIGGAEVVTYREVLKKTAGALGLRRNIVVPVPVLTPWLSSLWIHLVTPVGHRIARPLAEGLKNPVVCRNDEAAHLMPIGGNGLQSVDEAIGDAIESGKDGSETRWTDAGPIPGDPNWAGGTVFTDRRSTRISASPEQVYRCITRIGGRQGWFKSNWLWRVRGGMDRLFGGPGLDRGRRTPDTLVYGDVVDFWRVADARPGERLTLRAEMKLPGTATLEFSLEPYHRGCVLIQTAKFRPKGLLGLAYWFAVSPFHNLVFEDMLQGIRSQALNLASHDNRAHRRRLALTGSEC